MKKLRFITAVDESLLDEYVKNNRYQNIADNVSFAKMLGYKTSESNMHRYMTALRVKNNGKY